MIGESFSTIKVCLCLIIRANRLKNLPVLQDANADELKDLLWITGLSEEWEMACLLVGLLFVLSGPGEREKC